MGVLPMFFPASFRLVTTYHMECIPSPVRYATVRCMTCPGGATFKCGFFGTAAEAVAAHNASVAITTKMFFTWPSYEDHFGIERASSTRDSMHLSRTRGHAGGFS